MEEMTTLTMEVYTSSGDPEEIEISAPDGYRDFSWKDWKDFIAENIDELRDAIPVPSIRIEIYEGDASGIQDLSKIEITPALTKTAIRSGTVTLLS